MPNRFSERNAGDLPIRLNPNQSGRKSNSCGLLIPYRDNNLARIFANDQFRPDEFLYGGRQFITDPTRASYFNTRRGGRKSLLRIVLFPIELVFRLQTRLGLPLEMLFENWKEIRGAKQIFCSSDAIAFVFLTGKCMGLINARVIAVFQSLSERHRKYFHNNWILVWTLKKLLREADHLMTLTSLSTKYLEKAFEVEKSKAGVFTFGVDEGYWNYVEWSKQRESILVVGNDMNRDYFKLSEILDEGIKVTLVSTRRVPDHPNLTKLNAISNCALRKLYQSARMVFIPIVPLETEASGLSVALQGMSCGTPVCIAGNPALKEIFEHKKNVFFYDPKLANWKADVLTAFRQPDLLSTLSQRGRVFVENHRSSRIMHEQICKMLD